MLKFERWVLAGIMVGLFLLSGVMMKVASVAQEANRHATEANRILAERDFDRIHREHAELLRKCEGASR